MNDLTKKIKEMSSTNKVKILLIFISVLVAVLFIFQAGMFFGFRKASFSFRTGERYFKEMRNRGDDPMMGIRRDDFSNAHGAIGQIVAINLPTITVEDRDGFDRAISISTSTAIRSMRGDIKQEDLKLNDFIVVFGNPSDNQTVEARLIRIMPAPQDILQTNTSVK